VGPFPFFTGRLPGSGQSAIIEVQAKQQNKGGLTINTAKYYPWIFREYPNNDWAIHR